MARKRVTVMQVSAGAGLDVSRIREYLHARENMSPSALARLAIALSVHPSEIACVVTPRPHRSRRQGQPNRGIGGTPRKADIPFDLIGPELPPSLDADQ